MLEDSLRVERNEGRGTEEELVRFRDKDAKYAKVAFVSPTDGQVLQVSSPILYPDMV